MKQKNGEVSAASDYWLFRKNLPVSKTVTATIPGLMYPESSGHARRRISGTVKIQDKFVGARNKSRPGP